MSKNKQEAFVLMALAVVGSAVLNRYAKQQAATLGIPAIVVGFAGIAIVTAFG